MCRTRQEIISDEPDVQKLITLKNKLESGKVNGFTADRLYFELTKLEGQVESTIREFMQGDRQIEQADKLANIEAASRAGFEKHYEFHKKNPSLVTLFKKSPIGMLSLGGAGITASSLFYIQETRNIVLSLVGLEAVAGQELLNYGFPLFLVLLISGMVAFTNAKEKNN